MVACICHYPLHHQKPDFEGQSVIKASSYLLLLFLRHIESSYRAPVKPLLADSPPSLLKFTAQQISLLALHTFLSQVIEPRRLHSELRPSRCVLELHHRQDSKLPLLCCSSSSTAANCNFNIHSPGQELKIFRSRSTWSTDINHLYATSRGYEGAVIGKPQVLF